MTFSNFPNEIDLFKRKLNFSKTNNLVSDEEITLDSGRVWELEHDNLVNSNMIEVWTGLNKTGTKITNFTVSQNPNKRWKYSLTFDPSVLEGTYYVTYYTKGDEIEVDDFHRIEDAILAIQKYTRGLFVNVQAFGATGDGVTDDTGAVQSAIAFVMKNGGGTVFFPPGSYLIEGTIYTHQDDYTLDNSNSPLELKGATPMYADLYNGSKRNYSRLVKKNVGSIIGVNYTPTNEAKLGSSVYRNFAVKNLAFFGTGTMDTKYTEATAITTATNGIEMHRSAINIENCLFWKLDKGIAQPVIVNGDENYCDQSSYKRLAFRHMGTCWIEAYRTDASTFENLNGYNMAKSCLYGIYARTGEAFTIKEVLVAGHSMHLCPNFSLIHLRDTKSVELKSLYTERVEGIVVNMEENCRNITIDGIGVRHYAGTLIKGRTGVRNLVIKNINTKVEEDKKLSASDPGDYSVFDTISKPLDVDLDNTCYNIEVSNTFFRHAVHNPDGTFTDSSFRLVPTTNKTAFHYVGKPYIVNVYHDGTVIRGKCNGQIIDWNLMFGIATPTFNATTGEISFEGKGVFGNAPTTMLTGKVSGGGKVNIPVVSATSPLKVKVYDSTFALIDAPNIDFNLQIQF